MVSYRIGVDGGGTTTRAVIIDGAHNRVLMRAQSGSSNLYNLGLERALRNIEIAVEGALEGAGMLANQMDSWGFGLAGATGEHEKGLWTAALRARYGDGVLVDEDVVAALVGAVGPDELAQNGGAVLIAGTGANCFGQNKAGARVRADGWGPMLGDRGSGFWLGESAIRAAVASIDGVGAPTPLGKALLEHFEVADLDALVGVIYAPTFARDRIAAFVPFVLNAARAGDGVAGQLLRDAGTHLAATARAVLGQLGLGQLALAGGLLENVSEIRASLVQSLPGVELLQPRYEPVVGGRLDATRLVMNLEIRANYAALCREVAARIAELVRRKPDAVLGLATGSTPLGVYRELIRLHREEGLSFARVRSFNLDEYFPLAPDAPQSYRLFMNEQLFRFIDIALENTHVPDGRMRSVEEAATDCRDYESAIREAGGLDFQLLGIGRTGHIGFNEPGSARDTRTRMVVLDHLTRSDAAGDFFGIENVPARAITMGVGTIFEAREIALLASGRKKAGIVAEALTGKITSKVPASFLREHSNATFWLDENAAAEMPQRQGEPLGERQTIIRAALERRMPLWSLDGFEKSCVEEVEADLKKRMSDDALLPTDKTVFCLSPHPDDDVICCAATLLKLAARGNRVYVAYGVSGANAVRDKDVLALLRARHPRLIAYLEEHLEPGKSLEDAINEVRFSIFEREAGAPDAPLLRELKRLVREGEAADACRKMGAKPIFLNLPFYGDGANRYAFGEADLAVMHEALKRVKPDLVLLTGELSDPHGTHEVCEQVFEGAAHALEESVELKFERWLYRGGYLEWRVEEASFFSVFGKAEMDAKIGLILDHISQLDPMFPGGDAREFWERARDRNRQSARELQTLGLLPASRSFDPLFAELFQIVASPS